MVTATIFIVMVVLLALNVPIAMAIAFCTLAGIAVVGGQPLMIVAQRMFTGLDSFTLIAIPLFILAGRLMAVAGATKDLINIANALVGFLKGGLAYINITASLLFTGMTGSAAADASSIGSLLIPVMKERGYHVGFSVAITSTSSILGIIIPPSIPMVVYGVTTNTSIGKLFIGGFIPGFLMYFALMIVAWILCKKHNYPREEKVGMKQGIILIFKGIPALFTIIVIVGGIRGGYFTPTEGAGMAAFYSFLLGLFYYRTIKLRHIPKFMIEVAITTGQVTLMIATASAMGWLFARQNIPAEIGAFILGITTNKYLLLFIINVMLLFIGLFLDLSPAVIIFAPILLPIAVSIGIDPVHFGLIMVINLGIGLSTPPSGVCLFITCGIAKVSISSVIKDFLPFLTGGVIVLMIVSYIPELVMYLPNVLMK